MQPSPMLLALPNELLVAIYDFCIPVDRCDEMHREIHALRLTCKTLERAVFQEFGRFFIHKVFMLTEHSLDVSVNISKSRFAQFLSHASIAISHFTQKAQPLEDVGFSKDFDFHTRRSRRQKVCDAQAELLESGLDVVLLAKAFANLGYLKVMQIRREEWVPLADNKDSKFAACCFTKVLAALKLAEACPKTLELQVRRISDLAFETSSEPEPVLSAIGDFLLEVESCHSQYGVEALEGSAKSPDETRRTPSDAFCTSSKTSNIWASTMRSAKQPPFFKWLAAPVSTRQSEAHGPPSPVEFRHLHQLNVGDITGSSGWAVSTAVRPEDLLSLISEHQSTLRVLNLSVSLYNFENEKFEDQMPNMWQPFLRDLVSVPMRLESITIFEPRQLVHNHYFDGRVFLGQAQEATAAVIQGGYTVAHDGTDTMDFIQALADQAVVVKRGDVYDSNDNEFDTF
ncbi:Uu.00g047600.m01.CDS01 [Anthostomella pinea]|uniref:Uu.00g047600.m01.CDS01 n=1 Tax=Anthostomella pinea TaxID=933095 RepID=A0AAI8VC34_9PEZI|nr:Uu.00g047600.m01.CDS01 [Anthostomella pinea]